MNTLNTNEFMATGKLSALMRKFSTPCIVSLLVGALYNIVDQIFIANANYLGSYGNAANSVVFPLTVIALAVSCMIGDGCCAFVSLSLGAKNAKKAADGIGNALTAVIAVSLLLTAIYFCFATPILVAFGATVNQQTLEFSKEYFFYITLGIPFYMFGQAVNPIIRSDGSPKFAMSTLLVGAVANCILDPVFIFGFGWGMMGAAVATVIGQVLSAMLSFIYLFRFKAVRLQKSNFRVQKRVLFKILSLGAASFLAQISIVLSMAAVLNVCRKYGAVDPVFSKPELAQIPTAVIGIVMKFFQIIISVAIGLSAGCIPIVGYNIGAGLQERARRLLQRLLLTEAVIGLLATALFELFPTVFINLFGAAGESVHYTQFAIRSIRLFLCTATLACVNKGFSIYLQAVGKAWLSTALSLLREIVFGIGFILLLPIWLGLDGVLYFMAAADILTFLVSLPIIIHFLKPQSPPKATKN